MEAKQWQALPATVWLERSGVGLNELLAATIGVREINGRDICLFSHLYLGRRISIHFAWPGIEWSGPCIDVVLNSAGRHDYVIFLSDIAIQLKILWEFN